MGNKVLISFFLILFLHKTYVVDIIRTASVRQFLRYPTTYVYMENKMTPKFYQSAALSPVVILT